MGKVFALADRRRTWGEDRVYYHDDTGALCRMRAEWTSLAPVDPFVVTSAGRCDLRMRDLLELVEFVEHWRASGGGKKRGRRAAKASTE